jgi:hypothetical protein
VGEGHAEHGSGKDLRHRAGKLDGFFFRHAAYFCREIGSASTAGKRV